jgi:predicted peptidase
MDVDGKQRPYVVYVPRTYDPAKTWPLVVFLHGRGERGDDGLQQTAIGIGQAIRLHPERFPCIVVMAQCPESGHWDAAVNGITVSMEQTIAEYSIDPARITLTGLSMGGYGTWMYGAARAEQFAALMPICGGGDTGDAPALATLPIWAFHGDADDVVNVEESRAMVTAVKEAGGKIKYTEYPGVGHDSWTAAYNDAKAIKWLLKQRK